MDAVDIGFESWKLCQRCVFSFLVLLFGGYLIALGVRMQFVEQLRSYTIFVAYAVGLAMLLFALFLKSEHSCENVLASYSKKKLRRTAVKV